MAKKAAMEMSVGTIVTVVLLMAVLILGIFLVQRIFGSTTNAIDTIDNQVQSEINQLFSEGTNHISVYPSSREINVKRGEVKGFGFSVYNDNNDPSSSFTYTLDADNVADCGSSVTKAMADSYVLGGDGSFTLGPSAYLQNARLVRFNFPESFPSCLIFYNLNIERNGEIYDSAQILIHTK